MAIHPTAIVGPDAEIDPSADIGPYVVIEGHVRIGSGTRLNPFCHISGWTEIGRNCHLHAGVVVGNTPQDSAYKGERSYCRIGDNTTLREYVTVHRGTPPESVTSVGSNCLLMAYAHVAHNCTIADRVTMVNGATLAGHVSLDESVLISGGSCVHQFCRIGRNAMISGNTLVRSDVPPFFLVANDNTCVGYNRVGLRRAGFDRAESEEVKSCYRLLYRSGMPFSKAVAQLNEQVQTRTGRIIADFLNAPSRRGFIAARHLNRGATATSDGAESDVE